MNNEAIYSHVTVLNNGMHDSCVYQHRNIIQIDVQDTHHTIL